MDAIHLLHTRYSALKLGEPAPSTEAVRTMLQSAAHVPDHGRLAPWRLILVEGDGRVHLGEVLAESLLQRNPLASEQTLARERQKPLRAPLIIVVATKCDRSAKIPVIEQIISGGCAAFSIMQAAFAQGLGAMWRTGESAYDDTVKSALGIEADDFVVGFIYIGTEIGEPRTRPQRSIDTFTEHWTGPHSAAKKT
jgi:nitroreductase